MSDQKNTEDKIIAVEKWLIENNVDDIEVMLPDHAGIGRGKAMPRSKFIQGMRTRGLRMPDSLFAMTVNGQFIDNKFIKEREEDVFLTPQLETLVLVPWQDEPTASVICAVEHQDGSRAGMAPRTVLRRVLDLYSERGWNPIVAPEFEFYLIARQDDEHAPHRPPRGKSGKVDEGKDSYSIDGVDEFGALFDDVYDFCEIQNIQIDTLIHEAGPAQFEFNVNHGEPMSVADQSFYFKRLVKRAAIRHDMFASFMAKPYPEAYGSAMHIHQSIVDARTGMNIFAHEDGADTPIFLNYIGGLQKYLPAVMPFLAPYVNSYLRIGAGQSSPVNTHWGRENRTAGLRVPTSNPAGRRVENRVAGSDVNPYLAIAATLACGYLGIVGELKPSSPLTGSAYLKHTRSLPSHFLAGLDELERCEPLHEILGEEFVSVYLDIKRLEYNEFFSVISPWEIQNLMFNV